MGICSYQLKHYHIVLGDECWICHYEPESKWQIMHWKPFLLPESWDYGLQVEFLCWWCFVFPRALFVNIICDHSNKCILTWWKMNRNQLLHKTETLLQGVFVICQYIPSYHCLHCDNPSDTKLQSYWPLGPGSWFWFVWTHNGVLRVGWIADHDEEWE